MARAGLVWAMVTTWAAAASAQSPDAGVPMAPDAGVPADAGLAADAAVPADGGVAPRRYELTLPDGRRLDVGCTIRVSRQLRESMYVVCDDGRLLWVDVREGYFEQVAMRGTAVGLFEHSGRLWVELVRHEALALDPGMPGAIAARPAPQRPEPPRPQPAVQPPIPPVAVTSDEWERPPEAERDRRLHGRLEGWEVSAHLRPFLAEGGAGALLEVAAHHGFSAPLYVRLEVDPIGAAVGDDTTGAFGAALLTGYDHETFQVGLGLGTWYVHVREAERFAEGLAATLLQSARVGRRDGVHVEAKTTFVWVDGEILFGGLEGRLQAPIGDTNYIIFQGGGGIGGHLYGEVGARIWVTQREGGRGLYVIPAMGGAGIDRDGAESIVGPSVSIGLEIRP